MKDIIPDDIEDNMQLLNELYEWIDQRKDKYSPKKLMGVLISVGSQIGYFHYEDNIELSQAVVKLIYFGRDLANKVKNT